MHEDYPPFDFDLSSEDDGAEPHTSLRLTYPGHLARWQPLYKWLLAIPQYFVLAGLAIAAQAAAARLWQVSADLAGLTAVGGPPGQPLPRPA
jgi:hypothetical protein